MLELAQLRGDVPADVDLDLAVTLLIGPLLYRKVILREPVTAPFVAAVVDAVLRALRARVPSATEDALHPVEALVQPTQ